MRLPLLTLLLFTCSHSYKILVHIPKFAISHINYMGKIADTLVDAGHDVTALISEMDANLPDGTKKAQIIRVSPAEGANHMNTHFTGDGPALDVFDHDFETYSGMMENAYHNSVSICIQCRKLLSTPGLVAQLRMEKYDALITEAFDYCGVGLSHLITPRALIPVSSTFFFDLSSFGVHYSLITEHSVLTDGRFHNTLWTRIKSIYLWFVGHMFFSTMNTPLHKVFDELYPGTPPFSDILSNAAVAFSNSEPLIDFARPTIAKMVPIGGLTVAPPKPLDTYWDNILSLRPQTVLVSFGSIAKSVFMNPARKASLLKAFSSFPNTTFIWKYEMKDEFARSKVTMVPNVILTDWMPQLDILADPRLSLFISHAGMASCHEISTFGVPSLLIPVFGDQIHNAGALAHIGIAQVFNRFEMVRPEKVRAAIAEMLHDEKYKTTAVRIRDQLAARPTSPVERLVKNVEFAARFGQSKSLRPLNLDLSMFQLLGLDLLMVLLGSIIVLMIVLFYAFQLVRSVISIRIERKARKLE